MSLEISLHDYESMYRPIAAWRADEDLRGFMAAVGEARRKFGIPELMVAAARPCFQGKDAAGGMATRVAFVGKPEILLDLANDLVSALVGPESPERKDVNHVP